MTRHDFDIPLEQMIQAARQVLDWMNGRNQQALVDDVMLRDAITYRIATIGEASRRLPSEFRDAHRAVEWSKIIGLRNVVIHAYDRVDPARLWQVIRDDLQPLIDYLLPLLPPEGEEPEDRDRGLWDR